MMAESATCPLTRLGWPRWANRTRETVRELFEGAQLLAAGTQRMPGGVLATKESLLVAGLLIGTYRFATKDLAR